MTDVYVDVAAAVIEAGGGAVPDAEAARALRHLADSGLTVVLVDHDAAVPPELATTAGGRVVSAAPARPREQSWYVTTDVARCQGTSARMRTVLVGAAPPGGSVRRCDSVARDLAAAVLEILAAEAMPTGR